MAFANGNDNIVVLFGVNHNLRTRLFSRKVRFGVIFTKLSWSAEFLGNSFKWLEISLIFSICLALSCVLLCSDALQMV